MVMVVVKANGMAMTPSRPMDIVKSVKRIPNCTRLINRGCAHRVKQANRP